MVQDEVHKLIEVNNALTAEIHAVVAKGAAPGAAPSTPA